MVTLTRFLSRFRRGDERGASAVEYALVTVLIAIVIIGAVSVFGARTNGLFQKTCASMPNYTGTTC
jgi:Flp pilus assembly pilin Flp